MFCTAKWKYCMIKKWIVFSFFFSIIILLLFSFKSAFVILTNIIGVYTLQNCLNMLQICLTLFLRHYVKKNGKLTNMRILISKKKGKKTTKRRSLWELYIFNFVLILSIFFFFFSFVLVFIATASMKGGIKLRKQENLLKNLYF